MIDSADRLPDWAWTEEQIIASAIEVVNENKHRETPVHLCWYHLMKDGIPTGKAVLLAVESILDGSEAINKLCLEYDITCVIGEYGKETIANNWRIDAVREALYKFAYVGSIAPEIKHKVYSYETWMARLV